jgi:hypothetical protein
LPRRYFAGYVNGQPMVDRYIYGLRNAHGITIA